MLSVNLASKETNQPLHLPVMLDEAIDHLSLKQDGIYVDATAGHGGHLSIIADAIGPQGKIIGIDQDSYSLADLEERCHHDSRISLVEANFRDLTHVLADQGIAAIDGILFDLGISSMQLDDPERGFHFSSDAKLDMRMSPRSSTTAEQIVNRAPFEALARIFREYGDEPRSGKLARSICHARESKPIKTAADLRNLILSTLRPKSRIHGNKLLARNFQAIRMEVNQELEVLAEALQTAVDCLAPNGRIVVISFHSGEDRIVKRFFRSCEQLQVLTKKPLVPSDIETNRNRRSRSAKLRAAEKLS